MVLYKMKRCSKVLTYQRSSYPVLRFSRVVSEGVDDPTDDPKKTKNCCNFCVEEPGHKKQNQEKGNLLQCVLMCSLNKNWSIDLMDPYKFIELG